MVAVVGLSALTMTGQVPRLLPVLMPVLPEAPSALRAESAAADEVGVTPIPSGTVAGPVARRYAKHIPAGWVAQPLTAQQKVWLGFRHLYSPENFVDILAAASYSQVVDSEPNYGSGAKAFGQRLGAEALKSESEDLFTDSVFAPLLHEDPRYYVEGPKYSVVHRLGYAATRPFVTRNDSGRMTLNGATLLGYASASALTYSYYPAVNQDAGATARTYGDSLGGAVLGDVVREFAGQIAGALHLSRQR